MFEEYSYYMRRALNLAKRGLGLTSPNPLVGAVIVKDKKIIGEGYHRKFGAAHAEVEALRNCISSPKGAELLVTLEPCVHWGNTPPCTESIIQAGIEKVIIATKDPNPIVNGKGIEQLKARNIQVVLGVEEERAKRLNEVYFKFITKNLPWITLKVALTIDGSISLGEKKYLCSEAALKFVHKLRSIYDAILIGKGTLIKDNPLLTTRMLKGKSPQRIILTSDGKLPLDSNIVKSAREIKTIVATTNKINNADRVTLESYGIEVIILKEEKYKSWRGVDLNNLLEELGKRKITSVLIEGGSRVNYSFLNSGLVDKIIFLVTPFVLGNPPYVPLVAKRMTSLMKLEFLKSYKIGEDIVIESYLPSKK